MLVSALLSMPLALALAPLCRRLALQTSLTDLPRAERFHAVATPKLGGLAIGLALVPVAWVAASMGVLPRALLLGAAIAFLNGLADDRRGLRPALKFAGQLLASIVVVVPAARLETAWLGSVPVFLVVLVGVLWVTTYQNAVNFLDNMDGVAGGVAAITSLGLAAHLPAGGLRELAIGVGCACVGFLPHNARRPARLFLGDAGSQLLGLFVGASSFYAIVLARNVGAASAAGVIVLIPLLDLCFVTITRLKRGQSPAVGGKDHTTHRLYRLLGSVPQTFLCFWVAALVLAVISVLLRGLSPSFAALGATITALACVCMAARFGSLPRPT